MMKKTIAFSILSLCLLIVGGLCLLQPMNGNGGTRVERKTVANVERLAKKVKKTPTPTTAHLPKNTSVTKGSKIKIKAPKDATLYYTISTNGKAPKNPTKKSVKLNQGKSKTITISKETRVKAFAVKKGYGDSKVVSRIYKVTPPPPPKKRGSR